ncbi:hypothetical protein EKL32_28530 [Flavobacterium sp. GSN2]|nr:hypothetical protein EKL32_28530 [Flavobacterium sp. GSN2]
MGEVTKINEKLSKAFFILIIIGGIYLLIKSNKNRQEIEIHPGKTICKYTLCKEGRKSSSAFVKYVVDNKLYRTRAGGCPENSEEKINKYFFLKYSTLDPNKIQVDFSTEAKNKAEIEELEYKLKNWLDLK